MLKSIFVVNHVTLVCMCVCVPYIHITYTASWCDTTELIRTKFQSRQITSHKVLKALFINLFVYVCVSV